jgi:hypothetical protein
LRERSFVAARCVGWAAVCRLVWVTAEAGTAATKVVTRIAHTALKRTPGIASSALRILEDLPPSTMAGT